MSYNTKWLEAKAKNSNNEVWVIVFDGKVISGAKHRAFETVGRAKSSFSHMVYENGRTGGDIRKELERAGRLKFINLHENRIYGD